MAVFFFVVGLEVKREMIAGEPRRRASRGACRCSRRRPAWRVPAAVYLAIAGGDAGLARGWAIPAATDIAFAMGVSACSATACRRRCGCSC